MLWLNDLKACSGCLAGVLKEGELKAMKTLLHRLDVADDKTASKVMQTRDTYREAYGLEPGALQLTS